MEKYELTSEDKKFVDNLINAVRFVENVYVELCEAEVCHENDEYILSHIYELLYDSLDEQNKVMSYLKDGDSRINSIVDYMSKKYDYNDSLLDDVCVSTIDISNRDIKRALALINDKRINYNINKTDENVIDKMLTNSIILKSSIDLDYYYGYVFFMQELINDQMDLTIRRKLINCKYNLYYLNPRLEKEMLNNSFIVNDNLFHASKMTSDFLGYSDEVYYDLLQYECFTSASDNIDNIINLKEEELHKDYVSLLSFSAFIKSALLMMPDTSVSLLKQQTIKRIQDLQQDNYFKIDILNRVFDSYNENRSKQLILSLR